MDQTNLHSESYKKKKKEYKNKGKGRDCMSCFDSQNFPQTPKERLLSSK